MRYQPVDREDLVASVARQLRVAILAGTHRPGDRLPPERDLAAQFGVDRHTLRAALSELEQQALVHRRQGSGCRVLDFHRTGTLDLLKFLVVTPGTGETDPVIVSQAIEVGRVTFQGLMDLVVDRAGEDDLATMRAAHLELARAATAGDPDTIIAVERDFFRTIFNAAHSLVVTLLANTYDQIFDAAIDPEGRARLQWSDEVVASGRIEAYTEAIDAIERRDHHTARQLVDTILSGIPDVVTEAERTPSRSHRQAN